MTARADLESTAYGQWAKVASGLATVARQHQLIAFFVLAYSFSWLEILILGIWLDLPAALVIGLTTLGPTAAAVSMTFVIDGRAGLRRLLRRITLWRVEFRWYPFALFVVPLAYLAATLVMPGALGRFESESPVRWLVKYLIVLTAGGIIGGPFFEEPGWRGFALPRLQARLGPLRGTMILGALWGLWHMPQYFVPEWADQNGGLHAASIGVFLLTVMAIATIMTWVYNHTHGSLLLAMSVHSSVNTAQVMVVNELFPSMANTEVNALLGFGILAIVLVVGTRGRLGNPGDDITTTFGASRDQSTSDRDWQHPQVKAQGSNQWRN